MLRVMIDLETMGDGPDAAIVAIGACIFDHKTIRIDVPLFSHTVSLVSSMMAGGQVSASTVMWWLKQSAVARRALESEPHGSIGMAIQQFRKWWGDLPEQPVNVWSHGSTFDLVIMDQAHRRFGRSVPWGFRQVRDTRTVFSSVKLNVLNEEWAKATLIWPTQHVAHADACRQALVLLGIEARTGVGYFQ